MNISDSAATNIELPETLISSFLEALTAAGYSPQKLRQRRSVLLAFARWSRAKQIAVAEASELHFTAFAKRHRRSRDTRKKELSTLRRFFAYLRQRGILPSPSRPMSPADELAARYVDFLHTERGLAENSIRVYAPCVRAFLAHRVARAGQLALDALDTETIRSFLIERVAQRSSESARLLSIALRSLLRFLFLRGEIRRDLSGFPLTIRPLAKPTVGIPTWDFHPLLRGYSVGRNTYQPDGRAEKDHPIIWSNDMSDTRVKSGKCPVGSRNVGVTITVRSGAGPLQWMPAQSYEKSAFSGSRSLLKPGNSVTRAVNTCPRRLE